MFIKKLTKQIVCNPDEPVVQTPYGKLRGLIVDETYTFRGIKYADAARFGMPQRTARWDGVKDAIVHGAAAPEIQTVLPQDNYNVPHVFYPQNEDCQYLNLWTQSLDPAAKRPVMVWLHGGGYETGSGIEHFAYDGENMSKLGNVVVVTINHRLNVLGYLDLSEYGEKYRYSGNLGTADTIAALEWVRENIACFGGDPDNVTIFGQSGGGGKVAALMNSPRADGLFHKAIIQSGIGDGTTTPSGKRKMFARLLLEKLGLSEGNVGEIETVKYYRLARAADAARAEMAEKYGGFGFDPAADGDFYLGHPMSCGFSEHAKTIPIINGSVFAEFTNNFNAIVGDNDKNRWDEELKIAHIRECLGSNADEAIAAFRKTYPEKSVADVMYMDDFERRSCLRFAQLHSEIRRAPLYNYLFALESPIMNGTLAWHNAEIPYVFHNADYLEASYIPGVSEWLQDIVCGAWTRFAETGDPNHTGMPHWSAYTDDCHATMVFDEKTSQRIDFDRQLMDALSSVKRKTAPLTRGKAAHLFAGGPRG